MIGFFRNHYGRVVALLWGVIVLLFWFQHLYLSGPVRATLFLAVFIPTILETSFLSDVLLPQAVHRKKMRGFVVRFAALTLLTALVWALLFRYVGALQTQRYSFWQDFLFSIPSILVFNLGFCGLRFGYEHLRLQETHLKTQLRALQGQINPHFMFNILNHIHILMQTDTALASSLLLRYSDVLRYQLYRGAAERVRLEEEVRFMRDYTVIEKMRRGSRTEVREEWRYGRGDREVPPLLWIPFLENAFKYAADYVAVRFVEQDGRVVFEVENSKRALPKRAGASGLGLENVRRRLELLYGKGYRLEIAETETAYRVELEIERLWRD